jgi:hypothetical protein
MKCIYCECQCGSKKINNTNWKRDDSSCNVKHRGGFISLDNLNFFIKTNKIRGK